MKRTTENIRRRNLPHLYFNDGIYFITARLANTIPLEKLKQLHIQSSNINSLNFAKFKNHFLQYDAFLDKSLEGRSILKKTDCSAVIKQCLHYPDGKEYKLICFTIMPNHFHFVIELLKNNKGISKIMQSIKGISALRINKLLNKTGKFWQDESYDRLIRDDIEFYFVVRYILLNPVKAGLIDDWRKWEHTYCHPQHILI
ncbi:MAG: transposase [Ignavibacteriaceae bacterium]|nr:transposase [Ignavibacteriaceae bacterium]